MKKILIIPRSPDKISLDYKGHAYFENFYPRLAEHFELAILSSVVENTQSKENIKLIPWNFSGKDKDMDYIKETIPATLSAIKATARERPDVIMAENPLMLGLMGCIAGKVTETPVVTRVAGIWHGPLRDTLNQLTSTLATKIIAVSKCVARYMSDFTNTKKIEVIYPGTEFPEGIPKQNKSPSNKLIVGYLGRFSRAKGTNRFVNLVESIQDEDIEFKVAGWGDYKIDDIKKLDEKGKLDFLGRIPSEDVFDFLSNLDVLVAPSRSEGSPRTVVESLGVGTPVIAWDIPATREIIKDENFLINSIDEAINIVKNHSNYGKKTDWFEAKKYSVEREIENYIQFFNKMG